VPVEQTVEVPMAQTVVVERPVEKQVVVTATPWPAEMRYFLIDGNGGSINTKIKILKDHAYTIKVISGEIKTGSCDDCVLNSNNQGGPVIAVSYIPVGESLLAGILCEIPNCTFTTTRDGYLNFSPNQNYQGVVKVGIVEVPL
jgi:hypothetical protein